MTNKETIEILRRVEIAKPIKFEDYADIKEALNMAIKALEQQPCEDREQTSEDKKDIERQMWDDFHELTAKYYYYINAYEDMTKAGLPPCFTPRIDAKYIKCIADGIEQALGAIVKATKDLTERSGIDGEQRGQG